jgi:hypothetical protein
MFDVEDMWEPKFEIKQKFNIATYGSCFAQHLGRALKARNFNWLITENAPNGLSEESAKEFNYGVFSSRTGNIYTTSLLLQWIKWAEGEVLPPNEVWEKNGRYYDPFRPAIEPNGFSSAEEVLKSREKTIEKFKESIEHSVVFIFTLGLTESWVNSEHGQEYPMCPGTVAGEFDSAKHKFINQNFNTVFVNLREAIQRLVRLNPKIRFLFTVSPVPLTATNSKRNVIVATMASKSILRAVCDELTNNENRILDYFPSYEIINSPVFKGAFFEPNQRSVNPYGVDFVMSNFFKCLEAKFGPLPSLNLNKQSSEEVCEEVHLEAFKK